MPLARFRQWAALLALAALAPLAACEPGGDASTAGLDQTLEFAGAIAADEPRAALAAREMLEAGGSAADAAVALTFALAVTYPSVAGLGGGGQCLVYVQSETRDTIDALDFLPGRSSSADGGRASAVPGTVRAMDALQARYGTLRWSRTLVPAERLARLGHPVSRALARDLASAGNALLDDPAAGAVFGASDGLPRPEGEPFVQSDLATLLERLRLAGGADFYSGHTARRLVEAVAQAGGALGAEDLRRYQARWRSTMSLPFENEELHTAPGAGGAVAAAIWSIAGDDDRYGDAEGAERVGVLFEATRHAFVPPPASAGAASAAARLADVPTTSFAIVDRHGMAVACGLTMNGLFGEARLAPGTGFVLAAAPEPDLAPPLAPVMLINRNSRQVFLAAGAGGGAAAPSALARVMLELLDGERPLDAAMAAPRLHYDVSSGRTVVEPAIDGAARAALAKGGRRIVDLPAIGRVNAIHCPGGAPRDSNTCRFMSDRRGFGIAVGGTP